jgi:hypothetical protein
MNRLALFLPLYPLASLCGPETLPQTPAASVKSPLWQSFVKGGEGMEAYIGVGTDSGTAISLVLQHADHSSIVLLTDKVPRNSMRAA